MTQIKPELAQIEIGSRGVTRLEINLLKSGEHILEAVLMNAAGNVVEGLKANDDSAIIEYLFDNFAITHEIVKNAIAFRRNYDARFLAAEQFNDEQAKLYGGLAHEFLAGSVVYSVVNHPERRTARPNDPNIVTRQYFEVFAQDAKESDPDKAFIDSHCCDTEFDCVVWVRNRIERDLITEFANGTITV